MTSKRPTQADVARLAGVSRGTVSLVLNNRTQGRVPISEGTRERVIEAATNLGYAPNPVAQMLAQGNHALIGVFTYDRAFPYESDSFFFPYLTGIQRAASQQDYNVLLFTRHHHNGRAQVYTNSMNSLLLADGSILMGAEPDRDELRHLHDERYPFVYIGRREVPGCEIDWVTHDYQTVSIQAMQHLLRLGHRRIAFVSKVYYEPQQDKLAGCHRAIIDRLDVEFLTLWVGNFDTSEAFIKELYQRRITALLCDDRLVFEKIMALLHTQGLCVPGDISILSLTTAEHSLPYVLEPTHARLNERRVGEIASQMLVARIRQEVDGPQQILLPGEFAPGETTGAAP